MSGVRFPPAAPIFSFISILYVSRRLDFQCPESKFGGALVPVFVGKTSAFAFLAASAPACVPSAIKRGQLLAVGRAFDADFDPAVIVDSDALDDVALVPQRLKDCVQEVCETRRADGAIPNGDYRP
jgi:hypothetical protein